MCDLGIDVGNFNPRIFYTLKRKFNDASDTPHHSHDFITLMYILSGSCTYNIDDKLYPVKKGDLVVCNPGIGHGKIINPGEEVIEFHAGLSNIFIEGLPRNNLIARNECPVISLQNLEQEFFKCCSDIFFEQEKNEPGWELMLKTYVMKLIVIFLKATHHQEILHKDSDFSFDTYDKAIIVNTLISFINENYKKEISLDTISKNIYLSPVYISKVFKEEMGESPINYLIKVRLSKAHEMLLEGKLSIKAVAKNVGYNDAYYFSKLYKKYYNVSPSKSKSIHGDGSPG
jgi:AraC-like DNA-binding protein